MRCIYGLSSGYFNNFLNTLSSIILTPRFFALYNFDPDSSPATRKSVSLLTLEEALPPAFLTASSASDLENDFNVPVITMVFPESAWAGATNSAGRIAVQIRD